MIYRLFLAAYACAALVGCSSEIYPAESNWQRFFSEHKALLAEFADLIESEPNIVRIWCIPPGTIEVDSAEAKEPIKLTGKAFDAYNPYCIETQAIGAAIHPYGTSIMLETVASDFRYYRIDLVRLNNSSARESDCSWLTYLSNDFVCDVPLETDWVARYHWNSSNDIKILYE